MKPRTVRTVAARRALLLLAFAAVVGVLASSGPAPADASAGPSILPDREVEFASAGFTVHASMRAPAPGATGVPGVVIIGGSGDLDRDGNSPLTPVRLETYSWIADRLSALGVASIRYDKPGTGATGMGPYASDPTPLLGMDFDQLRVQPARDALALLAAQPGIDPNRMLVIGHSEGGLVTLALAHDPRNAPTPAGLALVEPQYGPILDILDRQISDRIASSVAAGLVTPADAATLITWMHAGIDEIRAGTPPYPAPGPVPLPGATGATAQHQSAIEDIIYGSDPREMLLAQSARTLYSKSDDATDMFAMAGSVRVPTLVTCGTKDFNTPCTPGGPPGSGVSPLAAAFPAGRARLVVLANTIHLLRDVGNDDPVTPEEKVSYPFSPTLAAELDAFVGAFVPAAPTSSTTTTTTAPTGAVVATPQFTG